MNILIRSLLASPDAGSAKTPRARKKKRAAPGGLSTPLPLTDSGQVQDDEQQTSPAYLPASLNDQGLVSKVNSERDIVVHIPYEDYFYDGDLMTLFLDDTPYAVAELGAGDSQPWITRVLPNSGTDLLEEGRYTVTYQVEDFAETKFIGAPRQPLRIDRTAPGGTTLPLIAFAEDAVEHGVTVHSLVDGFLVASVPDWYGMEDLDIIEPYYAEDPFDGAALYISAANTTVPLGGAGKDIEVKIPEAELRKIGDGPVWFGIVLRDQAGNVSTTRLQPIPLTLILEGAPIDTDLSAPIIARHDDDDLINEADARHPVEIQIPCFDKAEAGDTIIFYIGDAPTQPIPIDASEVANNPVLIFDLDYALFVEAGAGAERYTVDAYYELYRGTALLATSPRPNAIDVDITTPGGIDPNPETPENENLRSAKAVGKSKQDNYIDQDDILTDATVSVPWFAKAEDGTDRTYLAEGDILTVKWGAVTLADTHTVNKTDLTNEQPLEFIAEPSEMASGGVNQILISYTVSREQAIGPTNTSLSPSQTVTVVSAALLPGGPAGLVTGSFTEANAQNALNKAMVQSNGGTPFRVMLDYDNAAVGDRITLTLQGYYGLDGSGLTTPGTDLVLPPDPPYRVTAEDLGGAAKYHDFLIETAYFAGKWDVLPIGRGSVTAKYIIENDFGIANAPPQLVRVAVTDL